MVQYKHNRKGDLIMATSNKALNDKLRERYLSIVSDALCAKDEEVLRVGSNELALPCLDEEGNEKFIVVTIKVPTGSRDGDAYDGYSMAEDYQMKQAEKEAKARARAEKTAKNKEKAKKKKEK